MEKKISDEVREAIKKETTIRHWTDANIERFFDDVEERLSDAETHWLANVFQKRFPVPGIFKENLFNRACREIVAEWVPSDETIKNCIENNKDWISRNFKEPLTIREKAILRKIRNGEKFT